MLQSTASCQVDTSKGFYRNDYIRALAKDALLGDVYKAEFLRTDSLLTSYRDLKRNYDSTILILNQKDQAKQAIIGEVLGQNENLKKELEYYANWTKAIDKELHRAKVKSFFRDTGLFAVIGGLVYLLVKR